MNYIALFISYVNKMLITQTKQKGQTFLLAQLNCQVNQHAAKTILISVIISKSIKKCVCVCSLF